MTAAGGNRRSLSASDVLEQWVLVQGAFHDVFTVDLDEVLHVKSWKWFWTHVQYLLRHDNPLSRYFAPKPDPPAKEVPHFDGS